MAHFLAKVFAFFGTGGEAKRTERNIAASCFFSFFPRGKKIQRISGFVGGPPFCFDTRHLHLAILFFLFYMEVSFLQKRC